MKLIDLSHPYDPALFPTKHDSPSLEIRKVRTVEANGVNTCLITFDDHIGTHVDSPLHLVAEGSSVDEMPLDRFYGTAVVLDIPKGPNEAVTEEDLERARPAIEQGDIVVIRCGWGDRLSRPEYASHHPYLTEGAASWLVKRRVRLVGMDVQSVDLPHSLRQSGFRYTSLRVLLENGIPAILNLKHLEQLVGRRVTIFALPINFRGAEGAPARVVALVD